MPNGKVRFAAIYGTGAAVGFTPQDVRQMSIWQYQSAIDGYVAANYPEEDGKLSTREQDEIWDWLQAKG